MQLYGIFVTTKLGYYEDEDTWIIQDKDVYDYAEKAQDFFNEKVRTATWDTKCVAVYIMKFDNKNGLLYKDRLIDIVYDFHLD